VNPASPFIGEEKPNYYQLFGSDHVRPTPGVNGARRKAGVTYATSLTFEDFALLV